jgi:threonyl-tRNA synthetase
MRVRGFTQDDGHIFCTEDQIEAEVTVFNALVRKVYADFGFKDVAVKLALRPDSRVGSDEVWDKRGKSGLRAALCRARACSGKNCRARAPSTARRSSSTSRTPSAGSWQCGTLQLDFSLPGPLGAEYVAEDNGRHTGR